MIRIANSNKDLLCLHRTNHALEMGNDDLAVARSGKKGNVASHGSLDYNHAYHNESLESWYTRDNIHSPETKRRKIAKLKETRVVPASS